jgi:hypothetical protein
VVFLLSVLLGWGFALFPFHNISLAYIFDQSVLKVMGEAAATIFCVAMWVMLVSYILDRVCDWQDRPERRRLLQFLLAGFAPLAGMLCYVWYFYGFNMMKEAYMQFIYATYLLFLFVLNGQGYLVYLRRSELKTKLKLEKLTFYCEERDTENRVLKVKSRTLEDRIEYLQKEVARLNGEIDKHIGQIGVLKEEIGRKGVIIEGYKATVPQKSYTVRYSSGKVREFAQDQLAVFKVVGSVGKKPMIALFTKDGEQILTSEASLTTLEKQFDTFIRMNRQSLVSPDAIADFKQIKNVGVWVYLKNDLGPEEIKRERWKVVGGQIRNIVATNKKASDPSPDALT